MAQAIDMSDIDSALQGFTIPPRPDVLQQVQLEVDQDEPRLKVIAELINQDVGIAGFTLKVVNSPLFSLSRKITTIEHACMFLGLNRVIKLVNSIALRFTLSDGQEDLFTQRLWNSAMNVAACAAQLAQHFKLGSDVADDCYSLGLFHNAGMALVLSKNPNYEAELRQGYSLRAAIGEYEEQLYQTSHEVLGFLIAQSWGLTSDLCNVIAYHHSANIIMATGNAEDKNMFAILKLAEHLCAESKLLLGIDPDPEWERNNATILDHFELEAFQLYEVGDWLKEQGVENHYSR